MPAIGQARPRPAGRQYRNVSQSSRKGVRPGRSLTRPDHYIRAISEGVALIPACALVRQGWPPAPASANGFTHAIGAQQDDTVARADPELPRLKEQLVVRL